MTDDSSSRSRPPDGRTLVRLMILHDVGGSRAQTYVVVKIDSDYFVEE